MQTWLIKFQGKSRRGMVRIHGSLSVLSEQAWEESPAACLFFPHTAGLCLPCTDNYGIQEWPRIKPTEGSQKGTIGSKERLLVLPIATTLHNLQGSQSTLESCGKTWDPLFTLLPSSQRSWTSWLQLSASEMMKVSVIFSLVRHNTRHSHLKEKRFILAHVLSSVHSWLAGWQGSTAERSGREKLLTLWHPGSKVWKEGPGRKTLPSESRPHCSVL